MSNSSQIVNSQSKNGLQLEQLWRTVHNNPNDFVSWTLLLQYCEKSKNIDSIRGAFNEFLSKYPNCYIYWKRLAEYELQFLDQNKAFAVIEKAVEAFPISTDIWIYYIQTFLKYNVNEKEILCLFERSIKYCGQDFNSSDLWSLYLKWLTSNRDLSEVTLLYDRLFTVALRDLSKHFGNFKNFVNNNHPNRIISKYEYNLYETQYFKNHFNNTGNNRNQKVVVSVDGDNIKENEEKLSFIRKTIIEERKRIFDFTVNEIEERIHFEDAIKRPYFHINPLDIKQLDNWWQYLNWEINRNKPSKAIFLFERCLVPCALYEHMWIRYSNYLIEKRYQMIKTGEEFLDNFDSNIIRSVFKRAMEIHTKKSFNILNLWSLFEEREGNFEEAFNILDSFERENPYLIETTISKINLLLRKNDLISVENHFKGSIEKFVDFPKLSSHLAIKYSRFLNKVMKNRDKAIEVLNSALKSDQNNYVLYLRLIDIEYQKNEMNVTKIEEFFDKMIACIQSNSLKISMTQRKLQFLQDFGFDAQKIQSTIYGIQNLMHGFNESNEWIETKNIKRFKIDSIGQ